MNITYYSPIEYMRRTGRLSDGGPLPVSSPIFKRIRVAEIQERVAEAFDIPVAEMTSPRRDREVARPRQAAMWIARQVTLQSLPAIARMFGGRDRTTVIHAITQVERFLKDDADFRAKVLRAAEALR